MSGWTSYFSGRKDPKAITREAIVTLRLQLQLLEKKEDYLSKKTEEELTQAKANVISNKPAAAAALQRKKQHQQELDRLRGTRVTLETQVNAIESASFNAATMGALQKGADALRIMQGNLPIDEVDRIMESIHEQIELANEISDSISNPVNVSIEVDDEDLKAELARLEASELDEILSGAETVPQYLPLGVGVFRSREAGD